MTRFRSLLTGVAIATLGVAVGTWFGAMSQTLQQTNVSGQECWNAGQGPGGPSTGFLCTNVIRNGAALATFSGSGSFTTVMTPLQSTLFWVGTAPTTWTITLPTPAFDGEIVTVGTDTTLTSLVTVSPATGQTMDGTYNSQTISANASVEFQFSFATTKWYRLR